MMAMTTPRRRAWAAERVILGMLVGDRTDAAYVAEGASRQRHPGCAGGWTWPVGNSPPGRCGPLSILSPQSGHGSSPAAAAAIHSTRRFFLRFDPASEPTETAATTESTAKLSMRYPFHST